MKHDAAYIVQAINKVRLNPSLDSKAKARVILRILYKPYQVARIERMLVEQRLAFISSHIPRLFEKPSRPYLVKGLSSSVKTDLVIRHYEVLAEKFKRDVIKAIYTHKVPLLSLFMSSIGGEVDLHYDRAMEKEGELTLRLSLHGSRIYSVTFVLDANVLYIGSLQGSKSASEKIQYFTKITHGVRPQSFLIFLIRIMARQLGLSAIMAVTNRSHVYQARAKTQERIQFDYNTFWEENGGKPVSQRFFNLPLQQPRKNIADIPSKKRALYRRRFEFLDACAVALETELGALRIADGAAENSRYPN